MIIGKVVRSVEAVRKAQCMEGQKFLLVKTGETEFVAADQVGAAPGERVLLLTSSAAVRCCMEAPVDAAVVAVVDT